MSATALAISGLPETSSSTISHDVAFLQAVAGAGPSSIASSSSPSSHSSSQVPRPKARSHHSAPSLSHFVGTHKSPMKRAWNPCLRPSVAVVGEVDRTVGQGRLIAGPSPEKGATINVGDVERGLSELYVTHERRERAGAISPSKQLSTYNNTGGSSSSTLIRHEPVTIINGNEVSVEPALKTDKKGKGRVLAVEPDDTAEKRNGGWGGALVSGAMTAGVFGAGLGLSAYRLWTMRKERQEVSDILAADQQAETSSQSLHVNDTVQPPNSPSLSELDTVSTQTIEDALPSSDPDTTASPAEHEPPVHDAEVAPPAYEETEPLLPKPKEEWEELEEELVTPSSSRISTYKTSSYSYRSPRRKVVHGKCTRHNSSISRLSVTRGSIPIIKLSQPRSITEQYYAPQVMTEYDDVFSIVNADPYPIVSSTGRANGGERLTFRGTEIDAESGDPETDEMVLRLDSMSAQLSMLIEQGRKALESTSGMGVTPGWEDQEGRNDYPFLESASVGRAASHGGDAPASEPRATSRIPTRMQKDGHQKTLSVGDAQRRSRIPVRSRSMGMGLASAASTLARSGR